MVGIRSVNSRDPRLQRALLRASAGGLGSSLGKRMAIQGAFAANEMKEHLGQFENAEKMNAFKDNMNLRNKYLKLAMQQHKDKMKMEWKDIRQGRVDQKVGGLLGLGMVGLKAYTGRVQADAIEAQSKAERDWMESMLAESRAGWQAMLAKNYGSGTALRRTGTSMYNYRQDQ